jgi:hypothetical protein
MQLDENNNMQKLSAEAHDWLEAKRLEAQRKFADAAQVLNGVQNPSLRFARHFSLGIGPWFKF